MVQGLDHPDLNHAVEEVVAGDDDVVARIAPAQLVEELVVVGEEIFDDGHTSLVLELGHRLFVDVGRPVVEDDLPLRAGQARGQAEREAGSTGGGTHGGKKAPTVEGRGSGGAHLL